MSKEKQIESTDWLTKGISKEQLEREKQKAIMSADLEMCHTEFATGVGDIYTDYDETARKMFEKGYRKQSEWISVEERLPEKWQRVLVNYNGNVCISWQNANSTWFECWNDKVTHWMPLPELPKMKGDE